MEIIRAHVAKPAQGRSGPGPGWPRARAAQGLAGPGPRPGQPGPDIIFYTNKLQEKMTSLEQNLSE